MKIRQRLLMFRFYITVMLYFCSGCIYASPPPLQVTPDTPESTLSPVPSSPIEQILDGKLPLIPNQPLSYNGILPGKSTREEVEALRGSPKVIRKYGEYESLHYSTSGLEYFLLKEGVVQTITSELYANSSRKGFSGFKELNQRFSNAVVITPTFGSSTWVLPEFGLAFSVYGTYQFFVPMSVEEYKSLWGSYPLGKDPFLPIPSVEAVGITPGKTTQREVETLLGLPDESDAIWLYELEPDLLGKLWISFDSNGFVKNMTVDEIQRTFTVEEAISQYGQPDILQLMPGFEGHQYSGLALVYLKRGLRIASSCFADSCEIVKRDARIDQKWFFQPATLAEYKKIFPDSTFIQWERFDD